VGERASGLVTQVEEGIKWGMHAAAKAAEDTKEASNAAEYFEGVLCFEIPPAKISGMNFVNPLTEPAALALEMEAVHKRSFECMANAVQTIIWIPVIL